MITTDDLKLKKRTLQRLSKGITTINELKNLVKIYEHIYKTNNKSIKDIINYNCFKELFRRLEITVSSKNREAYPIKYVRYIIYCEYNNTKFFIASLGKILKSSLKFGDITTPQFYGQTQTKYKISFEAIIHILIRHNKIINSFINPDSIGYRYNPSSFELGLISEPMLIIFKVLRLIVDDDWHKSTKGKNMVCHFKIREQIYTIVRKGNSKDIITFYPRNNEEIQKFIDFRVDLENRKYIRI